MKILGFMYRYDYRIISDIKFLCLELSEFRTSRNLDVEKSVFINSNGLTKLFDVQ